MAVSIPLILSCSEADARDMERRMSVSVCYGLGAYGCKPRACSLHNTGNLRGNIPVSACLNRYHINIP